MDSFYGGKQGVSFVIKAKFSSVKEMISNFVKGNNFTDVWYGEYCLIDTVNKNNKDNGKIYRRGMLSSVNAVQGGAEYIGQIVGPSSGTPFFSFGSLQSVIDHKNEDFNVADEDIRVFPTEINEDTNEITQVNYRFDNDLGYYRDYNEDGAGIKVASYTVEDGSLVPGCVISSDGKVTTKKYNDDIKWSWCNVRKANTNNDSWFYVGFEIPYLVTDFSAKTISPYDANGKVINSCTIEEIKDKDENGKEIAHPFYKEWLLGIPKGIKGDSLGNLKVIAPSVGSDPDIYTWDQFEIDPTTGFTQLILNEDGSTPKPKYSTKENKEENYYGRQILVYEYHIYDKYQKPEINNNNKPGSAYYVYVGDFNIVNNISISQNGIVKVEYSHDGVKEEDKFFITQEEKLKWVENILINEDTGEITIQYNTLDDSGKKETSILSTKLKLIVSCNVSDEGKLTFGYNTGESFITKDISKGFIEDGELKYPDFILRTIEEVSLSTGLKDDKRFSVRYNVPRDGNNNNVEYIGNPINGIRSIIRNDSNFHLLILFDDKDHRFSPSSNIGITSPHTLTEDEANNYIAAGTQWVLRTEVGELPDATQVNSSYWWLDLGSVKDDAGVLIGRNVTEDFLRRVGTEPEKVDPPGDEPVEPQKPTKKDDQTDEDYQKELDEYDKNLLEYTKAKEDYDKKLSEYQKYREDVEFYNTNKVYLDDTTFWKYKESKDRDENILGYLSAKYPDGMINENGKALLGKIVTYGVDDGSKLFYAFDYDVNAWFFLGSITADTLFDIKMLSASGASAEDFKEIRANGIIAYYSQFVNNGLEVSSFWKECEKYEASV